MDLWDRLVWLSIGCFIGFVLGYIVRSLHEIKEKVEHVDEIVNDVKSSKWESEEGGFMRHPVAADIAVIVVVAITAWAAFSAGKVNAELQHTVSCVTKYNVREGKARQARDHSVEAGTASEIKLWTEYGKLYAQAEKDPSKIPALQDKLNSAIKAHRESLTNLQETRDDVPYPTPNVLENCNKE